MIVEEVLMHYSEYARLIDDSSCCFSSLEDAGHNSNQYFLAVFVGFLYGSLVAVVVIAGQDNAPSKGCMNNRLFVSNKKLLTRVEGGRAKHRFREASRRSYEIRSGAAHRIE